MRDFMVSAAAYLQSLQEKEAVNARKLACGKYERRDNPETGEREVVRKQKKDLPECGARCKSDGHPCRAKVVLGRTRCRVHGGTSPGPYTEAGVAAIAASNWRRAAARRQQRGGS